MDCKVERYELAEKENSSLRVLALGGVWITGESVCALDSVLSARPAEWSSFVILYRLISCNSPLFRSKHTLSTSLSWRIRSALVNGR